MTKSREKRFFTAVMTAVLCISAVGLAHSAWSVTGKTVNFLTMASYKNQIEEEYEIPGSVNPGEEIRKVVHVSNTGTVDTLVRIQLQKAFGIRRKDGTFAEDKSLDPEMILIECDRKYWEKKADGYYYYREVLKAGETTKKPLFTSYRLSEKAGNAYQGKDAQILVTMESVQAEGDAVSVWGVTYTDLGITRPEGETAKTTRVDYLGRDRGFELPASQTDLFASFKNLLPGCARTQRIEIRNLSGEDTEIFLRAEGVKQQEMSLRQLMLVKLLLNQYGIIEITGENGALYSGPVSGNAEGSGNTMRQNISLGKFKAGEEKTLTVKLSLSPEMDNKFQKLTGKVKWVFTAAGRETAEPVTGEIAPKTGDSARMGMWAALLITSAVFLAGAALIERRSRRAEKED